MTGFWQLDVEKSSWGKMQKPGTVTIEIEHNEPSLKYSGSVTYSDETLRGFWFDGAIDGKEYPVERSYGPGKATISRRSPWTIVSTYHSNDGLFAESATMTISRDGTTLTRHMRVKTPEVSHSWTEIYRKR
jgi:hypothetical protein